MEALHNWDAILRLDNSNVIDVLSGIAAVMSETQVLGDKETNDFRIWLSNLQNQSNHSHQSILTELEKQRSEFLLTVINHLGTIGLYQVILRRSFKDYVQNIHTQMETLASHLLKQSEMVFNRSFYIYFDQKAERRVLFSSFLIEQAEFLSELFLDLRSVLDELNCLPTESGIREEDRKNNIYQKLSINLGTQNTTDDVLPFTRESLIKFKIASSVKSFSTFISDAVDQLRWNKEHEPSPYLAILNESLSGEANLLEGVRLPHSSRLELLEVRRHALLASLAKIAQLTKSVCQLFTESVQGRKEALHSKQETSNDMKRYLVTRLTDLGVNPLKAIKCIEELLKYIADSHINPNELILSEVKKFNPSFNQEILDEFATIFNDNKMAFLQTNTKQRNVERVKTLSSILNYESLKSASKILALVVFGGMSIVGCGIKTDVKSDIIEARPEPPIRYEASLEQGLGDSSLTPGTDETIPPQGVPFEDIEDEFQDDEEESKKPRLN